VQKRIEIGLYDKSSQTYYFVTHQEQQIRTAHDLTKELNSMLEKMRTHKVKGEQVLVERIALSCENSAS
jgi:hypothetical protein